MNKKLNELLREISKKDVINEILKNDYINMLDQVSELADEKHPFIWRWFVVDMTKNQNGIITQIKKNKNFDAETGNHVYQLFHINENNKILFGNSNDYYAWKFELIENLLKSCFDDKEYFILNNQQVELVEKQIKMTVELLVKKARKYDLTLKEILKDFNIDQVIKKLIENEYDLYMFDELNQWCSKGESVYWQWFDTKYIKNNYMISEFNGMKVQPYNRERLNTEKFISMSTALSCEDLIYFNGSDIALVGNHEEYEKFRYELITKLFETAFNGNINQKEVNILDDMIDENIIFNINDEQFNILKKYFDLIIDSLIRANKLVS